MEAMRARSTFRWLPVVYLVIGVVLIATGVGGVLTPPLIEGFNPWWYLIPLVITCAAIWLQQHSIAAAISLASVAALACLPWGVQLSVALAWSDSAYAVARHGAPRLRRIVIAACSAAVVLTYGLGLATLDEPLLALLLALLLAAVVGISFWWGAEVRNGDDRAARADAAATLERERVATLARAAELARAEAVQRERTAVARELHDTVSAHLSSIALHATGALAAAPDTDHDRRALAESRTAALAGLEEMRALIRLLREPGEPLDLEVRDGLDALPELLERMRAGGLEVTAEVKPVTVSPAAGQALLRVAQEGLANAARHGAGGARLQLRHDGGRARLILQNQVARQDTVGPDEAGGPAGGLGAGVGLASMAARMDGVGGSLHIDHEGPSWCLIAEAPSSAARERVPEQAEEQAAEGAGENPR